MKKIELRKKIQKICFLVLIMTAFLSAAVSVKAEVDTNATFSVDSDYWDYWPSSAEISGKTACLMDADTGTILYSKGLDAQRFPASITKVMTALVVVENCNLDDQVTMTETGMADAYAGSSNSNPTLGEVFTVEDCLKMLLIKSANDIASQLAEHTAGSVAAFAQMMNEKAVSLGCTNTNFTNASGLEDENHYTSARDMALIMQAAIQNETIRNIMAMGECEIPATNCSQARYYSSHVLLMQEDSSFYYEGCLGGKTGYTDISQSTLVCYAQRNGMTLIGVVMGAPETESNASDMITLFNYGFDNFYHVNAVSEQSCLSGGIVTLPYGLDSSVLTLSAEDNTDGNKNIIFYIGDHRIGSCVMDQASYTQLQIARGEISQEEAQSSSEAAESTQQEAENQVTQESSQAETISSGEVEKKSGGSVVLYLIIVILIAAIAAVVFFLLQDLKRQKRKKRNRK